MCPCFLQWTEMKPALTSSPSSDATSALFPAQALDTELSYKKLREVQLHFPAPWFSKDEISKSLD